MLIRAHRYGAEVLPIALRSKVMGLAAASHFIVNVGITEAGPTAFATIKEVRTEARDSNVPQSAHILILTQNYYYVFVSCASVFLVIAYFYFP
jgi:hypothetical protein